MINTFVAQFVNEPALVNPLQADRFKACLEALAADPNAATLPTTASSDDDFWSAPQGSFLASLRPYVVKDGILQIPVKGVLLHNFPYAFGSWATGYDYIWRAFQRGCGDFKTGAIKGIALIHDTPGGMVAGCFDAVDKMYALKNSTGCPVRGFAQESAYSAGYAIISVADRINVSRTGGVGSIGVVTSHVDYSDALDKAGIKVTFIFAGKHKVDGNAYEGLSKDVKARIQARIDELYEVFVSTVERNRPQLSAEEIRKTEALCFTANEAVSNKLADSIGSLDDSLAAFATDLSTPTDGDDEAMSKETNDKTHTQADIDAAVVAARADEQAKTAAAVAEAVAAERARIGAIVGSEEAKGREAQAQHFAFKTGMSVEDAKAALATAPKQTAPETAENGTDFSAAMERTDNPNVGGEHNGGDGAEKKDDGSDVLALATKFGIKGFAAAK